MNLFTNSNDKHDFFKTALIDSIKENDYILIATAFFNDTEVINKAVEKNCNIKLIVRLSLATSIERLKEVYNKKNIHIRFFTSETFHPKLYIFGNSKAFIGSSNLTISGISRNQEINISIESDNPNFDDLKKCFYDYWEEAEVLDDDIIKKYSKIEKEYYDVDNKLKEFKHVLKEKIGDFKFNNITIIDKAKKNKKLSYISDFKRKYQIFLDCYKRLTEMYTSSLIKLEINRKYNYLPLKIEIDQFLNWIKENKIKKGESYDKINDDKIKSKLEFLIKEYYNDYDIQYEYIDNYNLCRDTLKENNINIVFYDDLYEALLFINAFKDRRRYFSNNSMKEEFLNSNNGLENIKRTIRYLLYDNEAYEIKMANCIYDKDLKLNYFGESCIKELYGVMSDDENIPLCNNRVFEAMEYLGFGNLK